MRIKSLKDLAKAIEALGGPYTIKLEKAWSSTDTKIAGTRLRRPGRGRTGLRMWVTNDTITPTHHPWALPSAGQSNVVFDYNTSETYCSLDDAIERALRVFGDKLDVNPEEEIEVGSTVKVTGNSRWATVIAVKRDRSRKVKEYVLRHANGYESPSPPWKVKRV